MKLGCGHHSTAEPICGASRSSAGQGAREAKQNIPGLFWGAGDEPGELQNPAAPVCTAHVVFLSEPLEVGGLSTLSKVAVLLLAEEGADMMLTWHGRS